MAKNFVEKITDMDLDFPQWFTDVVTQTELVDYGPVKGTMVIRPYGYAIWENIQKYLDTEFKKQGVKNAYFPMFIPESYLKREAEHVEGFAPEVAVVTYAGGKKLEENLIIRPTSETIICEMYAKWIKSYRDLPVKMNQWCNVCRWEKTTRPFLRTSEFLWQEGHTVYPDHEGAEKDVLTMLGVYERLGKDCLAIPFFTGKKTESEKFPGAENTYTIEAMMHDGKSLQSGTTHDLGQKFAKAFNIKFLNKNGELEYGYSTSWGVSTRLIGAIIMVHGDNRGLVLPPRVAPIQTIIIPIGQNNENVSKTAQNLEEELLKLGIRVETDKTENSPGWKFNQWEMKGVPVRVEIGPRDLENGVVTLVRRDTLEKVTCKVGDAAKEIVKLLDEIHVAMFEKALNYRNQRIENAESLEEILKVVDGKKFARVNICDHEDCCLKVKAETGATSRMIENENLEKGHKCALCGKEATRTVLFARSY